MARKKYGEKNKISALSIIEVIVIIILAVMIAGMVLCNIIFHDEKKAASVFGYSFYKTRAVTMVPEIPVNTVIIAKKSEIPNIVKGSVILCNIRERGSDRERVALTRVKEITEDENGKTYYIVKFDTAPENETFRVEKSAVIAKAVWQLESFGKFLDFATSVPGIIIAVVIPLVFVIIFQIIRINNIRELEREASSIDDIDDIFIRSEDEEPSPVTFTEPKFIEDVTDKIPIPPVRQHIPYAPEEPEEKPKAQLTVDANGRAYYAAPKTVPKKEPEKEASPFAGLESYTAEIPKQQPVTIGSRQEKAAASQDELYFNRPTRIEQREKVPSPAEDIPAPKPAGTEAKQSGFAPYLSNVIPDSLANIQEEAASSNTRQSFDDSVKAYFDRSERRLSEQAPAPAEDSDKLSTIPKMAVVPKENIAPVKKKKNSKTLEELMSIIDAEENKHKK